jgi:hypothetical protein
MLVLQPGTFANVDALARACSALPRWGAWLMSLRNAIVRPFGLKTAPEGGKHHDQMRPLARGDSAGIFPVLKRAEDEIVLGLDDKHLDFRLVLTSKSNGAEQRVQATTKDVHQ